jgi:5-formyltetrahydrofolate cyclo-ligase
MPKRSIRSRFLAERRSRPHAICVAASREIQQRFLLSSLFGDAGCLALYSAIHNEVGTDAVAEHALELGKTLVYPRTTDDHLEFVRVRARADMVTGRFGVLEPQGGELVPVEKLDLVVVPGVVFDSSGHRLGYGRGFYDRALSGCRADCAKVGFAYDFQLVTTLPAAQHDKRLSALVTESRILNFNA